MIFDWIAGNFDYIAFSGFWILLLLVVHLVRIGKSGYKPAQWVEALIFLLVLVGGWFLLSSEENAERRRIGAALSSQANIFAKELELMGHARVNESTPQSDPTYQAMIGAERRWLKLNPKIVDIYTLRKYPNGQKRFIVDSEFTPPKESAGVPQNRSPIGRIDRQIGDSIDVVFTGKPLFHEQSAAEPGAASVSIFVPMWDSNGAVEAALGVVYDSRSWAEAMRASRWRSMAFVSGLEVIVVIFGAMIALASSQVSERKRAQLALKESESRFQLHILQSPLGFVEWNLNAEVTQWNPAAEGIFGYTKGEVLGQKIFAKIVGEDLLPTLEKNWEDLIANRGCERITYQNRTKAGNTILCEWFNTPLVNKNGRVVGVASMFEDVTERERIALEVETLASFPRMNPNPVLQVGADASLQYYNQAAQEMVEALGVESVESILPEDIGEVVRECLATGNDNLKRESVLNHRTIYWSFFPIAQTRCVHCYAVDVTERINLESQLRQSQKMQSVGQLAAGIAHDFNNLLTVIIGHGELLRLGENLTEQGKESLEQITLASERAAKLTQQLLTFGRKQFMRMERIDLNEVIRRVTQMLSRVLGENIALRANLTPRLPAIDADPTMMEQIVMNLSVNARDAMANGGSLIIGTNPVLVTRAYVKRNPEAREGHFVCLSVSDNGIGIEPDQLNKLFEPFFTTKEVGKGTGLGLATVYGIVKQHKGWIEVESQPGHGTTFRVYLPSTNKSAPSESVSAPSRGVRGGNETILLVEDEEGVLALARSILSNYGYKVLEANSGVEALRVWEINPSIDLLFTDIVMPEGISGIELAKKLRAEKRDLKVIWSSGYSVEVAGQDFGLREGMAFLKKPYQPKDLARIVRETLDSK
jgi:PAS domain S-box-containing protein